MSPSAARLLALPFAALAFGLSVFTAWPTGPVRDMSDESFFPSKPIAVAALALPVLVYAMITRRRPASFRCEVDQRRFVAPSAPRFMTAPAWIMAGWFAGQGVGIGVDHGDLTFFLGVGGMTAAAAVWAVFIGRTTMSLTPTGLVIDQSGRRRREVTWDDVAPGEPQDPAGRRPGDVTLHLSDPETPDRPAGAGKSVALPTERLQVDPWFLLAAVRHYAVDSTHRGEIGTEAELARLRDSLQPRREPIS